LNSKIDIEQPELIGVIGIGLMGTAIGHRLLDHGYEIRVWNRTQPEADPLLQRGAQWSDNPLQDCQRVIVCLFNSLIVHQVLRNFATSLKPHQIIIDMTTGTPSDAETMAQQLVNHQAFYLDAPVSGSSEQTRRGEAMIMVGGNPSAFTACSDLWTALGRSVHFTGTSGSASRMKLVTNLVLGLNRAALAEGLAFAGQIGVEKDAALKILQDSAAASRVMDAKGRKMIERDFQVQARLSQHLKDVRLILELAQQSDFDLPLSQTHRQLLEKAENAGYGDVDNSAVICAYETNK
jgi:3-hydroxyisobutyrate dehydrogenase-like beta-hydroxyacid dehydrogenase